MNFFFDLLRLLRFISCLSCIKKDETETKDNEYYVEWQGAYKTKSNIPNLFVSVSSDVTQMYSMVELLRICSIYGFSYGFQRY